MNDNSTDEIFVGRRSGTNGLKTPADKLGLLPESAKSYCTDEEFLAGRAEAFAILHKSGFRAARTFAITVHDQYKIRAREMEESEDSRRPIHDEAWP